MKIQIAFDLTDLDKALKIAHEVQEQVDIMEIGTLLIYKYGTEAIKRFRESFPEKSILADAKIVDQGKDAISLLCEAGADWITILAGAPSSIIHTACFTAHEFGKKVMLDLIDAHSIGQSALEAKSLGVDALIFHKPASDSQFIFSERWDMVKGNTQVPIFVTSNISRENIAEILSIGAAGVIIGKSIIDSEDPKAETEYFYNVIDHK